MPIFWIVLDPARVQQELDAAGVAFGSRQVKGSPTVVVPKVHVHSLLVRAARKKEGGKLNTERASIASISRSPQVLTL